ncbi:MAG: hypothetical protein WC516_07445 [Patescibacteria group bacterium]
MLTVTGDYAEAVKALNRVCELNPVESHDIRDMSSRDPNGVRPSAQNGAIGKWLVVAICCELLEADSSRSVGDSITVTSYEAEGPEGLMALVNEGTSGREVRDIRALFDPRSGKWNASVSFPFSLHGECRV